MAAPPLAGSGGDHVPDGPALVGAMSPFVDLSPPYRTLVIDPPWEYDEGWPAWGTGPETRKALPYSSLTVDAIAALPIADLLAREGYAFLWTTSRYLPTAFDVLKAWGLRYRQVVTWCKEPRGLGPGGMFATTTEFVLIGQNIGPNSNAHSRQTIGRTDSSWFVWPRGPHSEKPDGFMDLIEQLSPGPYAELFARAPRLGWDSWGYGYESQAS